MTSNNAPVGKSSRTPDELVAGLEAVRVECLRTMTGDVLAGWNDVPPNYDLFLSGKGFARVEFRAETLAPLMAEAVALIRRLDRRAADAEDTLYADREERAHRERARHARLRSAANEDDTMPASHEAGPDSVPFPESEHGVASDIADPIANVLKQYDNFRKTFGNVFGDVLERLYGSTESAVSDSEGSGDGETPGSGGEAVTRPYTPVAGDVCTDRDGDTWTVSRVSDAHGPVLLSGSGYLDKTVTYVVQRWGSLEWENGEVTEAVAEDAGDVVPTPAVNDKCEDRDGHTWTVVDRCQSNGEPLLRQGSGVLSHESLSVVADTWGPLVWENGQITDGDTMDTDNDAGRDH